MTCPLFSLVFFLLKSLEKKQGWDLGNVTTPNLSMDSALNWSLGDRQDTEHDLSGGGAGDNIQAMAQDSDETGRGG